jgi:MFS family permease
MNDEEKAAHAGNASEQASVTHGKLRNNGTTQTRAAAVVLGSLLINVTTTGLANTFGIVLRSFQHDTTSPYRNDSAFNMGFVTGTAMGLLFVLGPFGNVLTSKFGVRVPIGMGIAIMTFALMMASLASRFYQLLLSQGILWGLGASLAFVPAMGLPSQYFVQKRGLATGIASAGSPLGAMILSPVIQAVIDGASIQWALRTLGFVTLALGILATALCRSKTSNKGLATQYRFMDLSVIKTRGYALYMLFAFLQMFGYALPVLTLPNYARALGLSNKRGSDVTIILNAGNLVGRVVGGLLGDKLGALNMLAAFTFSSGLLCVICWLFAKSFASLSVFAVLWGIGAGGYWSLTVPATATIVGMERLGSAVSINYLMNVIPPIFASSIGTAINDAHARKLGISAINDASAFQYLIVWAGLSYMVPALLVVIVRLMLDRRVFVRL